MIELQLHKKLHGAVADLRLEFDLRVERHSLCALSGPSGAGKTTLLRMLAGLSDPDGGRIVVDGVTWFDSARGIRLPTQQRSIGYVFQDYALFPNMTVAENVAYAAARSDGAWVAELLKLTGLDGLQQRSPATLSGGQQQRVALARALARKPALLLLDEPLSALDAEWRAQLQTELATLHERCGLTTLLVSHDIGEVFRLAQRVFMLEVGRIVRDGTPAEVFLQSRASGKLNLRAQVLAMRREDVVIILSLLVGSEIVDVIVTEDDINGMAVGDFVGISAKAFSPLIFK
jgi:molybdate transport system ATP-binding protein